MITKEAYTMLERFMILLSAVGIASLMMAYWLDASDRKDIIKAKKDCLRKHDIRQCDDFFNGDS